MVHEMLGITTARYATRYLSKFQRISTVTGKRYIVPDESRLILNLGGNTDKYIRPKLTENVSLGLFNFYN